MEVLLRGLGVLQRVMPDATGLGSAPLVSQLASRTGVCPVPLLMVLQLGGSQASLPPLRAVAHGAVFPPHGLVSAAIPLRPMQSPCVPRSVSPGCAAQRNFCEGTWCQNGGTCVSRWDTYLCECPLRFGGKNCEQGEGLTWVPAQPRGLGDLPPGHLGSHGGVCVLRRGLRWA